MSGEQRECGETPREPHAKSNQTLRGMLTQAGQAAGRPKHTYLGATYRRIAARRGRKRAAIAGGGAFWRLPTLSCEMVSNTRTWDANYHDEGVFAPSIAWRSAERTFVGIDGRDLRA